MSQRIRSAAKFKEILPKAPQMLKSSKSNPRILRKTILFRRKNPVKPNLWWLDDGTEEKRILE
jgi:hypothetical protein